MFRRGADECTLRTASPRHSPPCSSSVSRPSSSSRASLGSWVIASKVLATPTVLEQDVCHVSTQKHRPTSPQLQFDRQTSFLLSCSTYAFSVTTRFFTKPSCLPICFGPSSVCRTRCDRAVKYFLVFQICPKMQHCLNLALSELCRNSSCGSGG